MSLVKPLRLLDRPRVVRTDRKVTASVEKDLQQLQVVLCDLIAGAEYDVGRFPVGPLHEADFSPDLHQPLKVCLTSPEIRLEGDTDILVFLEYLRVDVKCLRGKGGALHVYPEHLLHRLS